MNKKLLILGTVTVALIGCTTLTPIDAVWPVVTNPLLDEYTKWETPRIKVFGMTFTSLAFAKGQKQLAESKHVIDEFYYTTGMKLYQSTITIAEEARDNTMDMLMALGAGTPAIGILTYLAGKKQKRPGDYTKEEVDALLAKNTPA